ncbi:ribonuclease III [Methanolobus sp. ZRKC5]|uniref:ribonuclease III n=1 Tax=unclassified Methanolobus TaxID=2629569 RepID=UPI00313EDD7D
MNVNTRLAVSLEIFQKRIGINFNNQSLLIEALMHKSFLNENPYFKERYGLIDGHNERLEFLGDSTLGHAIAEELYVNYPGREGNLTDIKKHYVEGNKLAKVAEEIELNEILVVGNGEAINELGRKARNENAVEALIGAIDQDQGYKKAKEFIIKYILYDLVNVLKDIEKMKKIDNPKGTVKEICDQSLDAHEYFVVKEEGPDHNKKFTVELDISGITVSTGEGFGIKKAEADAAEKYLQTLVNTEYMG